MNHTHAQTRADYDFVQTTDNAVMVTSGGLSRFARQWPCSGLMFDADIAVQFEFDASNGDLVDIQWFDCSDGADSLDIDEPRGINEQALLALAQHAQAYLNKCLRKQ